VQLFASPVQPRHTDERYTPRYVFDALDVAFDLDVAAPPGGVPWIPAARYFTADDDGLAHDWTGRVWCNPPFSDVGRWADRFAAHDAGVILFPTSLDALWLHRLLARVDPVLARFDFVHPDAVLRHVPSVIALGARGDVCAAAVAAAADRLPGSLLYHAGRRSARDVAAVLPATTAV
jgi:hypothetical protein